ncbi:MAG: hypothetical protein LH624_18495 [Cryobacterium sp.]|nr:hypothetical protein [Cryobacterium sp.]
MSHPKLQHVPAQQVCDIEAPGHTTRHLDLSFLMASVPVRIRVLSIDQQAVTFATESNVTTWFHHEPERLTAAADNWPTSWGLLPGSNILVAQAASDDEYLGQTFFFTCSDQPLGRCTLRPYIRPSTTAPPTAG